jgi:CRISPR-associated endonuclease/helicase Cas3
VSAGEDSLDVAGSAGLFWAKTGPGESFLPLNVHLRDAGAVASRLWDRALTPRQRGWYAARLGGDEACVRAWVSFLAEAHDVGKASPPFQMQVPELAARLLDPVLAKDGGTAEKLRHDAVSGAIVVDWLGNRGMRRREAERIVATISGHHAVPRPSSEVRRASRRVLREAKAWVPVQQQIVDDLALETGVGALPELDAEDGAVLVAVAGLVSISDWIASDATRFPVTDGKRPGSKQLATDAVRDAAWSVPLVPEGQDFPGLFGRSPRATQAALIEALDGLDLPALVIVEDRTGAGKTEAALWAAYRALTCGARGLYVGMPTRATAAQLHGRVKRFVTRLWPSSSESVRLLHGGVHLDEDVPFPSGVGIDERDARDVEAQAWFAQSRRGLLSPLAVGTIDQALLSVLNARHYPVRVWGLQGKVVVVDEVHAYDTYTGLLLARLVSWLAALDCTVVLLSATLPASRRGELVEAFRSGLDAAVPSCALSKPTGSLAYPRVTFATRGQVKSIVVTDDRPGRKIILEGCDVVDDPERVARRALYEAGHGGCVAVVCNTVAAAQARYRALRAVAEPRVGLVLLHARLRPLEREPIERRLLESLGPLDDARPVPPASLIVVATQVIEQSLDLDFDVMLSDLTAVDLLIQRAGRVHRHTGRQRPELHQAPRLVLLDTPGDAVDRARPQAADAVYVPAILVRTRVALRGRAAISEPDDLDALIGSVYDSSPDEITSDPREQDVLRKLDAQAAELKRQHGGWAERAAVGHPRAEEPPWETTSDPLQDPDEPMSTARNSAATRWSERPSLNVVVLRPDELPRSRHRPRGNEATELLLRSVSLSQPNVVHPILSMVDLFRPPAWRDNARLRHHFLIEVDADGRAIPVAAPSGDRVALPLRLDPHEGVIVETAS